MTRNQKCETPIFFHTKLIRSGCTSLVSLMKYYINGTKRYNNGPTRWVTSQYSPTVSVTKLLSKLKWASLADRRQYQRLHLFHKLNTGSVAINFSDFGIQKSDRVTRAGSKLGTDGQPIDNFKLHRPRNTRTPFGKSTIIRTIPVWNNLPWEAHTATSSTAFRRVVEHLP